MANPASSTYTVGAGLPIWAGKYSGGAFVGAVALGDLSPAAAMGSNLAAMSGAVALDDLSPASSLAGFNPPAWLTGKTVNQWFQISGTTFAGSAADQTGGGPENKVVYGAPALVGTEMLFPASGGHTNTADNGVPAIELNASSPTWVLRRAKFMGSTPADVDYYQTTPTVEPSLRRERIILKGELPSPIHRPSGCAFRTRCPVAFERCAAESPLLQPQGAQQVACWAVVASAG